MPMSQQLNVSPSIRRRAQESSNAIARMYISMRHLLNRGFYKPMGVSGETLFGGEQSAAGPSGTVFTTS